MCRHDRPVALNKIGKILSGGASGASGQVRLADDAVLAALLGTAQGHVSPFSLANDTGGAVEFWIDSAFLGAERCFFHPMQNTASVQIAPESLRTFVAATGHAINVLDFDALAEELEGGGAK
jgi:Ala-tRNA(Pro) deacylase